MRVRFTDEAKAKLKAIYRYIAEESPARASEMVGRISDRAEKIADFPHAGHKVPKYDRDDLREVMERPYRIIYRIGADEVQIISVMHYRQLLPEDIVQRT